MIQNHLQTIHDWLDAGAQAPLPQPVQSAIRLVTQAADDPDHPEPGLAALFGSVVERINDQLDPQLRPAYGQLFAQAIWYCCQQHTDLRQALQHWDIHSEDDLLTRWQQARALRPAPESVNRIVILSRVSIGADIALTTVLLSRLRQAYPDAELILIGNAKLQGLLGGMSNLHIEALRYARHGRLSDRLRSWFPLRQQIANLQPDLVVSPDSRLDQLGLLPICPVERYRLWESLQENTAAPQSLGLLLDRWCQQILPDSIDTPSWPSLAFDTPSKQSAACLRAAFGPRHIAAVKLDHGGNPAKSLPRKAELKILQVLRQRGWRLLIDRGFGADELENSDQLLAEAGLEAVDIDDSGKHLDQAVDQLQPGQLADADIIRFHGSIAGWAAALSACELAISYDSVGQHLAAALGVPVIVPFTGYSDPSFPIAWQPRGRAPGQIITLSAEEKNDPATWQRITAAIPAAGSGLALGRNPAY